MEVIVNRDGEPCRRRTTAAMRGAVREEVWPPGAAEEGCCDQAADQEEMRTCWFSPSSGSKDGLSERVTILGYTRIMNFNGHRRQWQAPSAVHIGKKGRGEGFEFGKIPSLSSTSR